MIGLLPGLCYWKGHQLNWGWPTVLSVTDANRHLRQYDTSFVTVRRATLWFRHLSLHFMKPSDFEEISVSKILHFVQSAGLLNTCTQELHERSSAVGVHGSLQWLPFMYSILFCSNTEQVHVNIWNVSPLFSAVLKNCYNKCKNRHFRLTWKWEWIQMSNILHIGNIF
jgi:hypothetical protein